MVSVPVIRSGLRSAFGSDWWLVLDVWLEMSVLKLKVIGKLAGFVAVAGRKLVGFG